MEVLQPEYRQSFIINPGSTTTIIYKQRPSTDPFLPVFAWPTAQHPPRHFRFLSSLSFTPTRSLDRTLSRKNGRQASTRPVHPATSPSYQVPLVVPTRDRDLYRHFYGACSLVGQGRGELAPGRAPSKRQGLDHRLIISPIRSRVYRSPGSTISLLRAWQGSYRRPSTTRRPCTTSPSID